ncbi:MAG: ATP-dependent DNA ligase [Bryobacterales bacterium]|nr:ATP-dependent DNA ligase [Bryobacteraceae bacterium]MDW8352999.1 ATP-dependent DNA ligase [Bryobacterales bacterium]
MRRFAETAEAVAGTSSKNEKIRILAAYLQSLPLEDAATAAVFFTGRPFPRSEEAVAAVGGSLLWQAVAALSGAPPDRMAETYRQHGDLGEAAAELLARRRPGPGLSLAQTAAGLRRLARERTQSGKLGVLTDLLAADSPVVAKYLIKILTGELRIGLKESLVEEAVAAAFGRAPDDVRRAHMLTGDIAETLRLAAAGALSSARLRLLRPVGFMLAGAAETAADLAAAFPGGAFIEDKYDGIRAQAHKHGDTVKLFSRTLDELVEFPELFDPLASLPGEWVLDGEIVAWRNDRPLPFTELQQRLGRKEADLFLPLEIPVRFIAFDILYRDSELLLDSPLERRRRILEALLAEAPAGVDLAPLAHARGREAFQREFEAALARGNEGIMAKSPRSPYIPGRRGRYWLKLKRPMATLDVVVTAVEYGHGKRRGLLSDYTFAVRDGDRFRNIGKAYSGLTDEEIRRLTGHFLEHTLEDEGFRKIVEPSVVLEVAFNAIQRSTRHDSGYALRFPRIVRLRPDKAPAEVDTLERVERLYRSQGWS